MKKSVNHIDPGTVFSKLTAIEIDRVVNRQVYWLCNCECGKTTTVRSDHLTKGRTVSCGCAKQTAQDFTGKVFGKLTVVKRDGSNDVGTPLWLCQCECGKHTHATSSQLNGNKKRSCGCSKAKENLNGHRFGRLVVIDSNLPSKKAKCICDCGNTSVVLKQSLKSGFTQSCGCLAIEVRRENATKIEYKDGKSRTKLHQTRLSMIARCSREGTSYHKKGIKVCARWMESLENFIEDMGEPPTDGDYSIDRIKGDLHYSCGHCEECLANGWDANCRWATAQEQAWNLSSNKPIEFNGESKCIGEWAQQYKIKIDTLRDRLVRGWTIEDAITKPVQLKRRNIS